MSTGTALKAVKGGKTEDTPDIRRITLRGVEYTLRELDVVEYKAVLKEATHEDGSTPFQELLDLMVARCVSPSPAAARPPLKYPVYRTLEDIVNVMHFITLRDESKPPTDDEEEDEASEEEVAPNS